MCLSGQGSFQLTTSGDTSKNVTVIFPYDIHKREFFAYSTLFPFELSTNRWKSCGVLYFSDLLVPILAVLLQIILPINDESEQEPTTSCDRHGCEWCEWKKQEGFTFSWPSCWCWSALSPLLAFLSYKSELVAGTVFRILQGFVLYRGLTLCPEINFWRSRWRRLSRWIIEHVSWVCILWDTTKICSDRPSKGPTRCSVHLSHRKSSKWSCSALPVLLSCPWV